MISLIDDRKCRAFLFLIGLAMVVVSATGDEQKVIPDWAKQKLQESIDREGIVEFFGKVIDQSGQPVAGAQVALHVQGSRIIYMDDLFPPTRLTLCSGVDGTFFIASNGKSIRGHTLFIDGITKEGYEENRFAWPDQVKSYIYTMDSPQRFEPDKDKPEVFEMRKKAANPAFLFQEMSMKFQIPVAESGKIIGYDFVQRGPIRNVENPKGDDASRVTDIQVKATFNTNDATWTVVLSPGNTNGGISVSEQLLYEAPDKGYKPEYTFTPEDRKPVKAKHVYLKSRDPAIYTRLEIEHINANKDFFRLSGKSVTNPYGERNLDQATDLPYEVTKQLTDEVKAAFRQNKRPVKPDLPKLVRDVKARTEKH